MKDKLIAGTVGLLLGAGAMNAQSPLAKLEQAQDAHFAETGEYFSVIEYETPDGQRGYELTYDDKGTRKHRGYGPESASRTWDGLEPPATTTHEVR